MKRIVLVVTLLALGLIPSSNTPAWSGPRQEKGQAALQHEVTVALKLVQVYVTDKRGNPISDLRRDEFSLYDNKDEKQITEFENHALSLPPAELRAASDVPLGTKPGPALPPPLMSRAFYFLFDFVFADAGGLRLARQAALRFLDKELGVEDQVAILSFTGGRCLNVLHPADRDRETARRAIEAAGLADRWEIAPIRPADVRAPVMTAGGMASGTEFGSRPDDSSVGRIVAGNFIWALDAFSRALLYSPGRKVIVLYSNGVHPSYLGHGGHFATGNNDLGSAYHDLCRRLAAANASVFAVNTEENTYLVRQIPETQKGVSSLREITSETGGSFLGDIYATPDHVERIEAATGAYYVLGYPIGLTWDGKFHSVRVKVSRPGCEVHAQPGYFNPKPFIECSKLEKEIHLVDLALSGKPLSQDPARFDMQALPVARTLKDNLAFIAEIPKDGLAGITGPNVEAVSLVFNALDEIVDSERTQIDLAVNSSDQNRVFFYAALSARPGTYKCRIVLRNIETGRAAVAGVSMTVPEGGADKLLVFPPLLASEAGATVLSGMAMDREGDSAGAIRIGQEFLFNPKRYSPFLGDHIRGGAVLAAAVRCAGPIDDLSGLELSAKLISQASGKELTVPLSVIEKRDGKNARLFLARLEIPEVDPGLYKLAFIANDSRSGLSSQVTKSYAIR